MGEKHRSKIRDGVEKMNGKLLDAQELQKLVSRSYEASERSAAKTRLDIGEAFDSLLRATENRCAELLRVLDEQTAEHRRKLERDTSECSTALVDACRTIDFLEKVLARGTDLD